MPGYVRGFVEREFADRWEFVCRVDPFTGSQGSFKYVLFGTGFASPLDPVVHAEGLPDDLAPATKLAMIGRHRDALGRLSNEDLNGRFREFREGLAGTPSPRHVSLAELLAFDWDRGIDDETRAALAENGADGSLRRALRLFELVDADGTAYAEWAPEGMESEDGTEQGGRRWRRRIAERGDAAALVSGDRVEFEGRTVSLRPRSRRELVPDRWFELLDLLAGDRRTVRLVFYWHH